MCVVQTVTVHLLLEKPVEDLCVQMHRIMEEKNQSFSSNKKEQTDEEKQLKAAILGSYSLVEVRFYNNNKCILYIQIYFSIDLQKVLRFKKRQVVVKGYLPQH